MFVPALRRIARAGAAFVACAAFATFAATSPGCSSDSTKGPTYTEACPSGQNCQVRLTLLQTADIHSRLLPYDLLVTQVDSDLGLGPNGSVVNVGGVARMAYILNRERARADRVLHIDGGDCFQGAPIFNFFGGEPEMRAQSFLGVDAMVIANHEFDRGPLNAALQIQKWASFPVLAANYKFEEASRPTNTLVGSVIEPFTVFNKDGLKVAVIGFGNLSSLSSLYEQPNKLNITPLNTAEVAQFYIDLLRPHVDLIVMDTHLGLEVDQRMIRNTSGIDVVMGSHNHIVINPPQTVADCSANPNTPGYIWAVDPNLTIDPNKAPPNDADHPDPANHPWMFKRACHPRKVVLSHSGAFSKYVGRLDLVLSNDPPQAASVTTDATYDPIDKFEVVSSSYVAFPIDATVPEDPRVKEMLEPYRRQLDRVADLDILVGYSPNGARRSAPQGGDSPLGNLVGTSIWLRLGVQTDFSLTNSTGIRTDLLPGPITIEQMYNIFPFDNSISKMQLSGTEVQELFDFVARRSASRGCTSQVQIAGAKVRLDCTGCQRAGARPACNTDEDCPSRDPGSCDLATKTCTLNACAEQVYIGHTETACKTDAECPDDSGQPLPSGCDRVAGRCRSLIRPTNLYELATSNYLAGGGSGFRVLQRNTTQFDTKIQQRDALVDYMRQGKPCGYKADAETSDGLKACATDGDCASEGDFVCACPASASSTGDGATLTCVSKEACDPGVGRCVLRACRTDVAKFNARRCADSPDRPSCMDKLSPCVVGGESCKILACVDDKAGAATDARVEMIGR